MSAIIHNILFLPSNQIDFYPSITSRLQLLSKNCKTNFSKCGIYSNCSGFVIMSIQLDKDNTISDPKEIQSFLQLLEKNSHKINGHIEAIVFPSHIELYDFCVDISQRKSGIGDKMLSTTLQFVTKPKVWLGIDFENPSYDILLKYYAKKGFSDPTSTYFTPSGLDIGFPVLGMTYTKGAIIEWEKTYKKGKMLEEMCITRVFIGKETIKNFYKMLSEEGEVGGRLKVVQKRKNMVEMNIDPDISRGETSVFINPDLVVFHSHPEMCYKKFNCFLGWPSGADMAYSLNSYAHIVITIEGLYVIKLSWEATKLIAEMSQETFIELKEIIRKEFTITESLRQKNIPSLELYSTLQQPSNEIYSHVYNKIKQFFDIVENFTINYVIQYLSPDYLQDETFDKPFFDVSLTSWDKASNGLEIDLNSTLLDQCPLF